MHLPIEQIVRVEVGGGTCSFVPPRAESRLSSFGFSGTIAHGAFGALGLPVRDTLFAASRYRGQSGGGVDLSPLLQTSVREPTSMWPGDSSPFLRTGWRFVPRSSGSRSSRLHVARGATEAAVVVANYRAGLGELEEERHGLRFTWRYLESGAGRVQAGTI